MVAERSILHESQCSFQILLAFSLCSAFTLGQLYVSIFYSMLAVPTYRLPIDTLEDLRRVAEPASEYRFYVQNNSFMMELFFRRNWPSDHIYNVIGQKLSLTPNAFYVSQRTMERLIDANEKNVIFSDRIGLDALDARSSINRRIHFGQATFSNALVGVVFPKRSQLIKPFNVM